MRQTRIIIAIAAVAIAGFAYVVAAQQKAPAASALPKVTVYKTPT